MGWSREKVSVREYTIHRLCWGWWFGERGSTLKGMEEGVTTMQGYAGGGGRDERGCMPGNW